jgi:hypothetical protein
LANSISYFGAGFLRASEVADLEQEKQQRAIERREKLAREVSPYDTLTGLVEIARTSTNDRTRVTAYWMLAELFCLRLKGLGDVSQLFDGWTAQERLDYTDKGEIPVRLYPGTDRKLMNFFLRFVFPWIPSKPMNGLVKRQNEFQLIALFQRKSTTLRKSRADRRHRRWATSLDVAPVLDLHLALPCCCICGRCQFAHSVKERLRLANKQPHGRQELDHACSNPVCLGRTND